MSYRLYPKPGPRQGLERPSLIDFSALALGWSMLSEANPFLWPAQVALQSSGPLEGFPGNCVQGWAEGKGALLSQAQT